MAQCSHSDVQLRTLYGATLSGRMQTEHAVQRVQLTQPAVEADVGQLHAPFGTSQPGAPVTPWVARYCSVPGIASLMRSPMGLPV